MAGAILAFAILAASMLLRLATVFTADGRAVSTLPPEVENVARMLHRASASGVALLALCAVVLCWRRRATDGYLATPVGWIVLSMIVLAVIGPLTPGYRNELITVLNVTVGMLMLVAFWWLRELAAMKATEARRPQDPLGQVALLVFLAHVATGANASAGEMHGVRWPAFLHVASLLVAVAFIVSAAFVRRNERTASRNIAALLALLTLQLIFGYSLMQQEVRPLWLALLHGLLSPLLSVALVSLGVRYPVQSTVLAVDSRPE
jgi:heme A synthase